ncbi:hypothetical protein ccbrp13_20940 [Ktedonobacteria bacterium brp13]|nr:hypothetical protein ccbrp13_20940 [Ktedonobacteria bacterium brp13]
MTSVETLFMNASTGKAIGQADMPVERLPQSFAQETTMHIGDEDWKVIKAEPMTAEEFIQTGKLVLTLQKVDKVPVKNIFFTLPTLCNEIPKILSGSTKEGKHVLELHEDDWRQIEFISLSYRSAIDFELAQIRSIYREASVNNGHLLAFKKVHVRQHINTPLPEEILLEQFVSFFTSALYRYEGISYQGTDGLIDGGFAFRTSAALFYGQQVEGIVKILGVKMVENVPVENKDISHSFQRFMATYNLALMDWCKPQLITANIETIDNFLEG